MGWILQPLRPDRQTAQALLRAETRLGRCRGSTGRNAHRTSPHPLQDQVTFLGHDLNPDAVANLKPDAEKLNKKADELVSRIDVTVQTANANITALQPE